MKMLSKRRKRKALSMAVRARASNIERVLVALDRLRSKCSFYIQSQLSFHTCGINFERPSTASDNFIDVGCKEEWSEKTLSVRKAQHTIMTGFIMLAELESASRVTAVEPKE
jgi:hypothetical protein